MVDFSTKQTGMSDVSGASIFKMNVQEGVVDKSGAMRTTAATGLIGDVGEAGVGAMRGYAMAEYEKGLLSEIDKYNAPKVAEEAAIEAAGLEKAGSLFAKGRGFDPALEASLKELEKGYTESVAKYEQAKTQGIISPEQFRINVLNETRKAVAANPGLYPELMAHAQKVMGLSGIEETIKSDQQKAKAFREQQDRYLKDIDDRLQKEHIYYDSTTPVYQKETLLRDAESATRAHTLFGRGKELLTAGREEAAIQWVNDNRNDLTLGAARELSSSITTLAGDKSTHYPTIKPQVEAAIDSYVAVYRANVPASIIGNPIVKDQIASVEKWAEGLKKGFNSLASGEDMKTYVENSLAITTAGQKADLAARINVPAAEMVLNWAKAFPNQVIKDPATLQSFLKASSDIASLNIETPTVQGMLPKNIADKNYAQLVTAAIDSSRKDKDFSGLNKMLEGSNMVADKIQDPIGKHIFLYNNIEALAKGDLTGSDISVYTKANKMIGSFLDDKNTGLPLMFSEMQKAGATVDVLPDGRMLFIGEQADQFNNKYGVKINTALQAYANAQGLSIKEAAGSFYPEYFTKHLGSKEVLQDPDIGPKIEVKVKETTSTKPTATNPLNLTVPGKKGHFQQFESDYQGIEAASKQLDRYFTGKTTGKPLQTVSDIVGTWNNENEKGSMSKDNYVATVVKHSGLSADTPLDLTNPKVKAALIYGMSIAEGNKIDPKKILNIVTPYKDIYAGTSTWKEPLKEYAVDTAKTYGKVLSEADALVFGAWRDLVTEGLMAEEEYRKRVQSKLKTKTPQTKKETSSVPDIFKG